MSADDRADSETDREDGAESEHGPPAGGSVGAASSFERFFGALGLAAAAVLLPLVVLAVDVAVSGPRPPDAARFAEALNLNLVSHDGRAMGAADYGVELELSAVTFYRNRPSQESGPYRINSHGCRGPEIDSEHRRPRVVILGGSAAFGLQATEVDTFAGRLAARHPELEIVNCGTVGYVSEQELGLFYFYLAELEPRLIVDFTGWNDLYSTYWLLNMGISDDPAYASNTGLLVMEDRLVRLRAVERSLWAAFSELSRSILARSTLLEWLRPAPPKRFEARFEASDVETVKHSFVGHLERLSALATTLGGQLLVVVQPEVGQTLNSDNRAWLRVKTPDYLPDDRYWETFPELYSRFRRGASAALRDRGIEVLDASEYLTVRRLGPGLFIDPVHLNPDGHAEMTDLISNRMTDLLAVAHGSSAE